VSDWARDANLATAADDRPALLLLRRGEGHLRLLLSWSLDPSATVLLDEVEASVAAAKLSQWTGVEISTAADGEHGLGVAWRPLTDHKSDASWDRSATAEIRWMTAEPSGPPSRPQRHSTMAQPLGFRSGHGPWGLARSGLRASQLGGRAFFAWTEGSEILGARSTDTAASFIAPSEIREAGAPLIDLQSRPSGLDMILLHNLPKVRGFRIRCD
jgi:hypothetical protein